MPKYTAQACEYMCMHGLVDTCITRVNWDRTHWGLTGVNPDHDGSDMYNYVYRIHYFPAKTYTVIW